MRADDPDTVVLVRSRHRLRALAELSRRLEADHAALLTGCALVLVDRDGE